MKSVVTFLNAALAGIVLCSLGFSQIESAALQSATVSGTGSAYHIPVWTSSTTLGNSWLFQKGSNTGVGTLTPVAKFDVTASSPLIALKGYNNATTGSTVGVLGQVISNAGIAGVFNNAACALGSCSGKILSGRNNGQEVFSVIATGKLTATAINDDALVGKSESGAGVLGSSGLAGGLDAIGVRGIAQSSHAVAAMLAEGNQVEALIAQNGISALPSGIPPATVEIKSSNDRDLGYGDLLLARTASGSCVIDVFGNFACTGSKSAVVPISADKKVQLYAMESPENWFEDFGSAKLASGIGTVTLDAVFAQTVNSSIEYHVFLTPNGDCKGLYIANKTASSFEVREIGDGKSNVSFDYRVVARRKGYEGVRLADATETTKVKALPARSNHGQQVANGATNAFVTTISAR